MYKLLTNLDRVMNLIILAAEQIIHKLDPRPPVLTGKADRVPAVTAQRFRCDETSSLYRLRATFSWIDSVNNSIIRVLLPVKAVAVSTEPFLASSARTKFLFKL